jgi:hypothetical protein
VQTPELSPPPGGTPRAPTGHTFGSEQSEIVNLQAGYMCSYTSLPRAEFFEDDKDSKHDTYIDPDILTDES